MIPLRNVNKIVFRNVSKPHPRNHLVYALSEQVRHIRLTSCPLPWVLVNANHCVCALVTSTDFLHQNHTQRTRGHRDVKLLRRIDDSDCSHLILLLIDPNTSLQVILHGKIQLFLQVISCQNLQIARSCFNDEDFCFKNP